MNDDEVKSQGRKGPAGVGGGRPSNPGPPSVPPGTKVPPGQENKPPKTDEEVQEILEATFPTETEFAELTRDIFLRLLPVAYNEAILTSQTTGQTRQRAEALHRHAEQIALVVLNSKSSVTAEFELQKTRTARKLKFFS